MSTKILVLTHHNFSHLVREVAETLNLPIELQLLEIGFGEVDKNIDLEHIHNFDMVITSGAHLEMIKRDFNELFYTIPIFPLKFTQADLVKAIVEARQHGRKMILMYFTDDKYEIEKYKTILDIDLLHVSFKDLDDAKTQLLIYKAQGYRTVIGTSSICELAHSIGCASVLVYSHDSLRLELMKAYQLAATRRKMLQHVKMKDVLFRYSRSPLFLLDNKGLISDCNPAAVRYMDKKTKQEIIGENITLFFHTRHFTGDGTKEWSEQPVIHTVKKENRHVSEMVMPIYVNKKLDGFVAMIDTQEQARETAFPSVTDSPKSKYQFKNIVAEAAAMKKVIVKAQQYARSSAPIHIYGESGTGKELLAHSIHNYSERREFPFMPVNCAAIPENILESELFGYEDGTFTGAKKGGKAGLFEMAQGGTIFLDEIGEIPLDIQTKLLRVLQEKEVIRLGGRRIIPLDVRIITATNKSLAHLIATGEFREDLYYRINVLQLVIPPLRDRYEDILPIFTQLLHKHGISSEQAAYLAGAAKHRLASYAWPGNIRELENFVLRIAALISVETNLMELLKVFEDVLTENITQGNTQVAESAPSSFLPFFFNKESEKVSIMNALIECKGSKNKAAEQLGISRTTLWRKMKELNIQANDI